MKEVREMFGNDFKERTTTLGLKWNLCLKWNLGLNSGLKWNLETDEFVPATLLNLHDNYRGLPGGPQLRDTDLDVEKLTRAHICRLVPQMWDHLGKYHGPNQATGKILLSKVTKAVPLANLHDPIELYDTDLAKVCTTFFKRLANTEMIPTPRVCLKIGYRITAVYCDHDASHLAVGAVVLVLSENDAGDKDCHMILAKSVISNATVISNEVKSHACGAMLLITFFTAIKPLIKPGDKFEIISLTDNAPSTYVFKNESKAVLNRNVRNTVLRCLVTLQDLVPNTQLTMAWCSSELMTSEFVTKIYPDAPDIVNSSRWRHGHPLLKAPQAMKHFWFLQSNGRIIKYRDLPVLDVRDNFLETVAANPIKDSDSHVIIFDTDDNKLDEFFPEDKEMVNNIMEESFKAKDHKMSVDEFINVIMNDEEIFDEKNHATFLADVEIEELAGLHIDQENALEVYHHSATYHLVSEEKDNKIFASRATEAKFSQKDFEEGFLDKNKSNVLEGMQAPQPMGKELYDKLMGRSNDIVVIINLLMVLVQVFRKKKADRVTPEEAWAMLVSSDQALYPGSKKTDNRVSNVNGFVVVGLRLENITLPCLDRSGLLLQKVLASHHREKSRLGWLHTSHVPASVTRSKFLNCKYGVYCFSLNDEIRRMLDQCSHCLRTQLKKFKIKDGDRFTLINPDIRLFQNASGDPIGPITCKQWKSARRASLTVYLLLLVCHETGASVIQILGDLTAKSVILGLMTIERRLNVSLKNLYFDKGSSLSSSLLESRERQWTVYQQPPTAHFRIYAERKIGEFRKLFNRVNRKFAKETKPCVPLDIYQMHFLAANIQLTLNSIPYSPYSNMCPAILLHARGLVNGFLFSVQEKDDKSLRALYNWSEDIQRFRHELLAEVMKRGDMVAENDPERYVPINGDIVLALTGSLNTAEQARVTVCPMNKETSDHPDANKVSERSVIIANKNGSERLYPSVNLRLLVEGNERRRFKMLAETHNHDFVKMPGNISTFAFINLILVKFQERQNNNCTTKLTKSIRANDCEKLTFHLLFSLSDLYIVFVPVPEYQWTIDHTKSRMCGALWSQGGLKVEAEFSSEKYQDHSGDSSSVYYNWVNGSASHVLYYIYPSVINICRIYEPSMRHLESVINHLQEADKDILMYLVIGLTVSWVIVLVVTSLRYFYGCKLAKEHDTEPDIRLPRFHPHSRGGSMSQQSMMHGAPPPDLGPEGSVSYQPRRTSMADTDRNEITIKVEGASKSG